MSSFTSSIPSGRSVTVRIIDSTTCITNLPTDALMKPGMPGMKHMPALPTWSFLVEHESGGKILFDLGVPVDWREMAPVVSDRITTNGWGINVEKSTIDILKEEGINAEEIEAIVWSHFHWDHIGNPSHFPPSTKLIVGPGFTSDSNLYPGYPTNPKSKLRDIDFADRKLHQIDFKLDDPQTIKLDPFRAHDYFGDGSFYILDTPGHAQGHIAGLARTTTGQSPEESTFIFMGGDLTHHAGELRPSTHLPLPLPSSNPTSTSHPTYPNSTYRHPIQCPGDLSDIYTLQTTRSRHPEPTTPFFDPNMGADMDQVIATIADTQIADADPNVLYIFAHDRQARGIIDVFPAEANGWKSKGWREALLWKFIEDFDGALGEVKNKNAGAGMGREKNESSGKL